MSRNSLVLIALLLAGCDKMTVGNRTERSGEPRVASANVTEQNVSEAPEGEGSPMAWRVVNGAAFYGAADQPPVFALRCERGSQSIVFERAGGGTAMNLSAEGGSASLGTRDAGNGRVQARTSMNDGVLDAMARPQSQVIVSGGAEALTVPGGVAIRRVVDFCRTPPEPHLPAPDATSAPANVAAPAPAPSVTPPPG
ncbi:hypothetical protein ACFSCW_14140 [Sphingomonas tabacisoli]|uniref:Lipoprotein n=1 Tax=Sphingomonas tabacisoli TaxID=2249466 RepID=A0ABW4I4M9_9SPHN